MMQLLEEIEDPRAEDSQNVPKHIALIMDGNRRWAREKGLPIMLGHWKGADSLISVVETAADLGVKVLTVYAFSTENWTRAHEEVDVLMAIFKEFLISKKEKMLRENVRFETIGNLSRIPPEVISVIEETKQATRHNTRMDLVLAINYGGRDDIRRAAIGLAQDVQQGKVAIDEISEKKFGTYLDTAQWGDPDLLIRTSGEQRLSNFLLWQLSYTEIYITSTLWPDFGEGDLLEAIHVYQARKRRHGGG